MENTNEKQSILALENFPGNMVLLLFFQITVFILERIIYLKNPVSWRNWETFRDQELKETRVLDYFKLKDSDKLKPTEKLIKYVKKMRILFLYAGESMHPVKLREAIEKEHKVSQQIRNDNSTFDD